MHDFDAQAEIEIPAEIFMIGGCQDSEESGDVSNTKTFHLPDPKGKAGGASTAALLSVLYDHHEKGNFNDISWVRLLAEMKLNLEDKG